MNHNIWLDDLSDRSPDAVVDVHGGDDNLIIWPGLFDDISSLPSIWDPICAVTSSLNSLSLDTMSTDRAKSKYWTFTLNHPSPEEIDTVDRFVDTLNSCDYCIYGKEIGENGTPHLQGQLCFTERVRFGQVRGWIGSRFHIEQTRELQKSIQYCKKDGDWYEFGSVPGPQGERTDLDEFKSAVKSGVLSLKQIREDHSACYARYTRFCVEYIADHYPKKDIVYHPLRVWQADLNSILNLPPDDRSIYFIVDPIGNSGKTWFAHYYAGTHKDDQVQVIQPAKKADMAFVLRVDIRVLFIDAPRSKQGEFIQYDFLEDVKNGYVFSTKYESRVKNMDKVHVVVLMNELPDMSKLSADRYQIIMVDQSKNVPASDVM